MAYRKDQRDINVQPDSAKATSSGPWDNHLTSWSLSPLSVKQA